MAVSACRGGAALSAGLIRLPATGPVSTEQMPRCRSLALRSAKEVELAEASQCHLQVRLLEVRVAVSERLRGEEKPKFLDYIYGQVRIIVMKFLLKCGCIWLFSLVLLVTFFRTLRSREILPPACDLDNKMPFMHVSNGKDDATVNRIRRMQI